MLSQLKTVKNREATRHSKICSMPICQCTYVKPMPNRYVWYSLIYSSLACTLHSEITLLYKPFALELNNLLCRLRTNDSLCGSLSPMTSTSTDKQFSIDSILGKVGYIVRLTNL